MAVSGTVNSEEKAFSGQLWHTLNSGDALTILEADLQQGLSAVQVRDRQQRYGLNQLVEAKGRSKWEILLDQFANIMLLMLLGVAIVSAAIDLMARHFPKDAIAILLIVGLNGLLGYLQETRAEQALASLKKLSSPIVSVLRDGIWHSLAAPELVPGDIVQLETGGQLPADGRLLQAVTLQVREAALTGEAVAVMKQAETTLAANASLGDRVNMAYQGTEIVRGRGTMLVTATGMQTELGKVASMLQNVEAEPTPLQQRMSQLGNVLVGSSLGLVVLVVVGGLLRTRDLSIFSSLLETSLSMAVAVVPEGLPAVITVTLAIGTQRMVRRHALIRKLPAVETLGSVTTICSDKTGTLTQNKMLVTEVCTASDQFQVSGDGYSPAGTFHQEGQPVGIPAREPELVSLLLAAGLCNDALLQQDEAGRWTISGDPTEGALLPLVAKAGLNVKVLRQQFPRQQEIPFDSARKRMSAIVAHQPTVEEAHSNVALLDWLTSQPFLVTMKGSPEAVLDSCDRIAVDNHILPLAENYRCQILVQNDRLAQQGLRVLGFAARPLDCLPADPEAEGVESQLIWLGLVGMLDAPRPEVRQAVHQCRQAGIRPIMITGDHPLTAMAIARDLGIAMAEDDAVTGSVLEGMTQDQLEQTVQTASVYARVAPEHKLRIVRALQAQGEFVAMTGDGINDAPAIKQGNIGIAMGITGTDVSKEASDMVLLDDNFATIVAAVEEGRVVYTNIRHFIRYILGSNIGEVLTIAAVPLLGIGGTPLTPLQILWMNLVTDGIPALALAMEPADPATMQQRPLNPRASIFSDGVGAYMVRIGVIFALITIAMIVTVYQVWPQAWPTMVFTTLCLAQMGHALAARSYSRLVVQLNPLTNIYLLWAVGLTTLLQIALLYVPSLSRFFGTTPLSLTQIEVCIGFSLLVFVWIELEKLFARWIVPLFQSSPVQT